ncbi:hypothetical protein NQ318_022660 [Aromia moschata]|uniref:Uncharacterized protein n=1 Tax=Aromia moschata TaxID=1265417 RepID=A0AAV8YNH9_9CUCU|nr:hypothetical protein NQ318_022660 [Aromia moschata]
MKPLPLIDIFNCYKLKSYLLLQPYSLVKMEVFTIEFSSNKMELLHILRYMLEIFVLQFREMVYLTEMQKITISRKISGVAADLSDKIERQFRERGYVRQLQKNPPNKLSDDQKLDFLQKSAVIYYITSSFPFCLFLVTQRFFIAKLKVVPKRFGIFKHDRWNCQQQSGVDARKTISHTWKIQYGGQENLENKILMCRVSRNMPRDIGVRMVIRAGCRGVEARGNEESGGPFNQ